ncbi:universal stress protein [Amycolatopsis sp. BJA-103]|uniref:universal stress protein n=1 Tax=unclassified Amycolatopsis TaxID=2618356 RepID=UPI000C77F9B6|nr:universal stress protein [Amycolatopsis sp. BJA-103]AUI60281.1 universal stress protein [Amycolatopsis sp. BJA-103]PNE16304.1 universal stress protein [Amycolatopsis sp. BJA-103]
MSTADHKIVVGVDGSGPGRAAVRWAAGSAAERGLGLLIVHALHTERISYGGGLTGAAPWFDVLAEAGQRVLDEASAEATSFAPDVPVSTAMPQGSPVPFLIDTSMTATMVVLGGAGKGFFAEMAIGSTASAVLAHAQCPVVVLRGRKGTTNYPGSGPVVVGVDGSPLSEQALETAFEEASRRRAHLVAVHAWTDVTYDDAFGTARLTTQWESLEDDERRLLAEQLAGWQEKYPDVTVERVVVRDRPRQTLLEWSGKAQLVVVGSRGRGGFTGLLLGSTSQALAHHAECPVMVVRPRNAR